MHGVAQRSAPEPVGAVTPVRARATRRGFCVRTFSPKADDITRSWHVIDAEGMVLGRLATEVASRLRGQAQADLRPPRRHR